ncbi:MAG: hypoxanthine phosphoribosyltransferase [Planctomycetota bacterium]
MNDDIAEILFSEEAILRAIDRLALEITAAYRGGDLTVVSVLKGSCVFASDLIRRIPIPLELAFVAAASYRNGTAPGPLEVSYFPTDAEIAGRRLLLVDDILDTGRTLSAIRDALLARGAREVLCCVFLDKTARRRVDLRADFQGFVVPDRFVVGYGLDFAGRYRNLPFVAALKPEILAAAASR